MEIKTLNGNLYTFDNATGMILNEGLDTDPKRMEMYNKFKTFCQKEH